jgi:hypothetical protein
MKRNGGTQRNPSKDRRYAAPNHGLAWPRLWPWLPFASPCVQDSNGPRGRVLGWPGDWLGPASAGYNEIHAHGPHRQTLLLLFLASK